MRGALTRTAAVLLVLVGAAAWWALPAAASPGSLPAEPRVLASTAGSRPDVDEDAEVAAPGTDPAPGGLVQLLRPEQLAAALADQPAPSRTGLPEDLASLTAGAPRPKWVWNPQRLVGDLSAPVISRTSSWIVPLVQGQTSVGYLETTDGTDGPAAILQVTSDAEAAADIRDLPRGLPLVQDGTSRGWFTIERGQVRPVDAVARDLLAGSMPAHEYIALVAGRSQAPAPDPGADTPEPAADWWAPLAVGGGILLVLLSTVVTVWVQRPDEDEEDERPGRAMLELRRPTTRASAVPTETGSDG